MVALVQTVAYLGLEVRRVEVQCQLASGLPAFQIVGLPDKAVGESRERVRAALADAAGAGRGTHPREGVRVQLGLRRPSCTRPNPRAPRRSRR